MYCCRAVKSLLISTPNLFPMFVNVHNSVARWEHCLRGVSPLQQTLVPNYEFLWLSFHLPHFFNNSSACSNFLKTFLSFSSHFDFCWGWVLSMYYGMSLKGSTPQINCIENIDIDISIPWELFLHFLKKSLYKFLSFINKSTIIFPVIYWSLQKTWIFKNLANYSSSMQNRLEIWKYLRSYVLVLVRLITLHMGFCQSKPWTRVCVRSF